MIRESVRAAEIFEHQGTGGAARRYSAMNDPFNLARFVNAQTTTYATAFGEIARGAKRTHWMWFVFPQLDGLGQSDMARRYALGSLAEAKAYLDHPILGTRIRACVSALQDLPATSARTIFGPIDARKLQSSLTLFTEAGAGSMFEAALGRWFDGQQDLATLELLHGATVNGQHR